MRVIWDIFLRWYTENTLFVLDPDLKYNYNKMFFAKTYDEWLSLKEFFNISMDLYFNLKEYTMLRYRYNHQRYYYIKLYFGKVVYRKNQEADYRLIAEDETVMKQMVEKMREVSDEKW